MRKDDRLATLDGIRSIASLIVPVTHLPVLFSGIQMRNAYLAVDLFFCLSGFVISRVYEHQFSSGNLDTRSFVFMRVVRFFPLYVVGLFFGSLIIVLRMSDFGAIPWGALIALILVALPQLCFLPVPFFPTLFPFDPPAWSLSSELLLNIAFAAGIKRFSQRVTCIILLVAFAALVVSAIGGGLNRGYTWSSLPVGLSRAAFSFSLGVMLCRFVRPVRVQSNLIAWAIVGLIGLCLSIDDPAEFSGSYAVVLIAIVFPAAIYIAAHIEPRGLTRRIFIAGGSVSYGVYILHQPLGGAIEWIVTARGGFSQAQIHLAAMLSIPLIICLTFLLLTVYEPPVKRNLRGGAACSDRVPRF